MLEVVQAAILIFLAEIGDKTFFVAVLLAAKYNALPVFIGCMLALALSTAIAAAVGYLVAGLLGPTLLSFIAAALFLGFAFWLLWEWYRYDDEESAEKEAEEELTSRIAASESYGATSSTEEFNTPPGESSGDLPWWRVIGLAFSMNFIGELGDKTQIAVAVQASTSDPIWVAVGALIGFALVTAIAVLFGKTIANYLSPRAILLVAAAAFFAFGVMSLVQGIANYGKLAEEKPDEPDAHHLSMRIVTDGLKKSFAEVGFLLKSPVLEKNSPVTGTSWSFHAVFGCGLFAGVLLAGVVCLIWRFYVRPFQLMEKTPSPRDEGAASSWEPPLPQPPAIPESQRSHRSGRTTHSSTVSEYVAPETLQLFSHRCGWLVGLMLVQSLSAELLESFKVLLRDHPNIIFFLTMLVGAGGNSGAQSAVLAVRQIALKQNVRLSSALLMGFKLASILAIVAALRCLLWMSWIESWTIAIALWIIVVFAVLIGTALPLLLDRFKIDPAHSIATIQVLMDIFGVCITCFMGVLFLDYVTAAPHVKTQPWGKF